MTGIKKTLSLFIYLKEKTDHATQGYIQKQRDESGSREYGESWIRTWKEQGKVWDLRV